MKIHKAQSKLVISKIKITKLNNMDLSKIQGGNLQFDDLSHGGNNGDIRTFTM